jgi:hypothetical protein
MPEQNQSDDVALVLEQLRTSVRAQRQALGGADSTQAQELNAIERQLQHSTEQLEITRVVSAHWPLESRSPFEQARNFVHKVVRRGLRWYINPIVEQQNAFNDITARTLRLLIEGYIDLLRQDQRIRQEADDDNHAAGSAVSRPAQHTTNHAPPAGDSDTQQLQQYVEAQAQQEPPALLLDVAIKPQHAALVQHHQVNAHWYLGGPTVLETLVSYVQRAIRLYLRWLINPLVEQQNAFHSAIVDTMGPLLDADAELRSRYAARRARQQ